MEFHPVDVTALVAITLGSMVVLIPIMGATVRFAAKPLIDALLQAGLLAPRSTQSNDAELARLSRRVLELEQALEQHKALQAAAPPVSADVASLDLRRVRT